MPNYYEIMRQFLLKLFFIKLLSFCFKTLSYVRNVDISIEGIKKDYENTECFSPLCHWAPDFPFWKYVVVPKI
jgi:hypothetical protein